VRNRDVIVGELLAPDGSGAVFFVEEAASSSGAPPSPGRGLTLRGGGPNTRQAERSWGHEK
jgi:hypothetical protein